MAEACAGLGVSQEDGNRAELRKRYEDALNRDPRLEPMILYRSELVRCLDPEPLLDHMGTLLSDGKIEVIKTTLQNTGKISAARQLLDALLASGNRHLYTNFLDILRQEGHDKAIGLMQGIRHIEKDQVFQEVIKLLRSSIVRVMVVNVCLLNELVKEGCISEETKGTIECLLETKGQATAASALLDKVYMRIRDWPEGLMRALTSSRNTLVVDLLSADFREPGKSFEDVIEAMAIANPVPVVPERPYDQEDADLADDINSRSSSLNSSNAQNINQTTVNHGSGNFTVFAEGGATVNISSTVNIQSPDGSLKDGESSMSTDQDVRSESEYHQSSPSVDAMDAPRRDDSIGMNGSAASSASVSNGKNGVINASMDQSEDGKSDAATGGEKDDDDHDEKQDSEDTKENDKNELVLYDYQEKLARPGIEGKNTIICAPTGSGKTIIAAGIMKDHLKNDPGKRKVIFLACEVALANQQNKQFEKFLSPEFKSFVISGGAESGDKVPPIKMLLHDYDIIVMTAQLLVNAMVSPKAAKFDNEMDLVKFDDFSMMIFDECHHTGSDHPYNRIMTRYVDQKLEGHKNLPQVLGLTASLGVGKAPSMSKAIEHVVMMCANLDAEELSNPDEEMMEQIHETSNKPVMKTTIAKSRNPDPFLEMISGMMSDIEKKLRRSCEGEDKGFQLVFGNIPAEKGSQPYIQWISRIQKPIESSTVLSPIDRQRSLKYLSYLKTYNRALLINRECRTRDALEYLKDEFQKIENVRIKDTEDDDYFQVELVDDGQKDAEQEWLERQFKEVEPELVKISQNPRFQNPMLETLKEKILDKFPDAVSKANGRGIIFVQEREMTVALCRWIREDDDLKDWNPEILVGANAKDPGSASMTQTKQLNILDYFKSGQHKLLVATSVAEEGLDIQKCNLIIRYNYVTNEIAMVQSRGRARADDSTYEVLTGGTLGAKKAQKENLNKIREKMMLMAIETVKKMSKEEYRKHVFSRQEKFSKERKISAISRTKKKAIGNQQGPYVILCRWCTKPLCQAEELRLLAGTHHSVLSDDFKDKYRTKMATKPKVFDDIELKGKITCKNCFQELGVFALYKRVPFPLLKVTNLLIENTVKDLKNQPMMDDEDEPMMNRKGYRQWKDVPFTVKDITDDELKDAMRVVEGPDEDDVSVE